MGIKRVVLEFSNKVKLNCNDIVNLNTNLQVNAGMRSDAGVQKIVEKPLDVDDELTADIAGAAERWVVAGVLVAPNHGSVLVQHGAWEH